MNVAAVTVYLTITFRIFPFENKSLSKEKTVVRLHSKFLTLVEFHRVSTEDRVPPTHIKNRV